MRTPDRRQNSAVRSLRGSTQPRGPASTRMAGSRVTAARNATPMPTANATPTVENTPSLAKPIPRKVTAHRRGGRGDHLADGDQRPLHGPVRIIAEPDVVVIAADEEDGVIRSRTGDHRAEEHDRLVRDRQPGDHEIAATTPWAVSSDAPIVINGQHHGGRVAVDDRQDEQQQDGDGQLDRKAVVGARHGQVGDGRRQDRSGWP